MNPIEFPVGLPVQTGKRLRHTKVQGKWFSQTISYKKTIVAENCSKIVILHFARFLKSLLIGDYNVFIFGEVFGQINMTTYLVKDSTLFRLDNSVLSNSKISMGFWEQKLLGSKGREFYSKGILRSKNFWDFSVRIHEGDWFQTFLTHWVSYGKWGNTLRFCHEPGTIMYYPHISMGNFLGVNNY